MAVQKKGQMIDMRKRLMSSTGFWNYNPQFSKVVKNVPYLNI